ncbi:MULTISPECIES: Nif3-like dinuclear metal center hexameric protein [Shouchella]|uniref:GTP cyclohydrolase 1 type 2 homolog n=1 Tax=Shouchella hunanensis TaxID=766894 RepID=A0ABY7W2Z7_9BACI|nr:MULTISPECIES: Nif3-like dinuclear metal center hexameric protein [Shouchella]WDF03048.1 Nif3-like dinuclear metal center hexameric protein [Shouchella hunanensis]
MTKGVTAQNVIKEFEQFSPRKYAVEGDRNGLMVGTLNKPIHTVMIALDVLEETMDEAIDKNVDLIIAHHPLLFRPLKQINLDTAMGRIVAKAIKHEITIYAAHTNLDVTEGGVNDLLAEKLMIQSPDVLVPTYKENLLKFVGFVPREHAEVIRQALGEAGAGFIGEYSHCAFSVVGEGTFRPTGEANPHIGELNKQEVVEEERIETIVPKTHLQSVLNAFFAAHPYEEPAYDLIPLESPSLVRGLGRIGKLEQPQSLRDYVKVVKLALGLEGVRVVGNLDRKIKKVAVLGGDGNKYVNQALRKGADVLVTGDLYYHVAQDAKMDGLTIIDAGHHIESIMKAGVAKELNKRMKDMGYSITVFPSSDSTDPFQFM